MNIKKNNKLLIASTVFASLSMSAVAVEVNYNHFSHSNVSDNKFYQYEVREVGVTSSSIVPVKSKLKKAVSHGSVKATTSVSADIERTECSFEDIIDLSTNGLVDYVKGSAFSCFSGTDFAAQLFGDDSKYHQNLPSIFTKANMLALAEAIKTSSMSWVPNSEWSGAEVDLYGPISLMEFVRSTTYAAGTHGIKYEWYDSATFAMDADVSQALIEASLAFSANLHFLELNKLPQSEAVRFYTSFLHNMHLFVDTYDSVAKVFFEQYPNVEWKGSPDLIAHNILDNASFAVMKYAANDFDVRMADKVSEWQGILIELYGKTVPSDVQSSALTRLAEFFNFDSVRADTIKSFDALMAQSEYLSSPWRVAIGWADYLGICESFTQKICRVDVEQDVMAKMFPNTFSFDDGEFVVRTAISESEVQELYHAAKQVEAQYKRAKQDLDAVSNDPNQVLIMYVYGTHQDYLDLQAFLFNLSTDNGGIYIEQDGTFYTYQRTGDESIYSLEELFRHEYVHYLNGRYTIDGMWGETAFYENERLTWWDEGSAEFFAGSTQKDGVLVRKSMVRDIVNDGENRYSVSDVLSSSYDTGFKFYRYSALFFNYLNANQPETITELYKLGKAGDIAGFDALVAQLSADATLQANYDAYLDAQVAAYDTMTDFAATEVPNLDLLTANNAEDIQAVLETELPGSACDIAATDMNHRFACTGTISADTVAGLDAKLDGAISALASNEVNNFKAMNCAYGVVTAGETTYHCEGPLRNMGVDLPSNEAPVVDAGENHSVDEGATVNLSGSASDADGDALTITWSQTGGTSVTLTGADTLTPSFTAPEVTANTTLTFELSVTDGEATTTDTVTITVNNTTTNNGGGPTGDAGNKSSGGGSMGIFSGLGLLLLAFRRKACIR